MRVFLDLDLVLVNVFPLWESEWVHPIAAKLGMDARSVYDVDSRLEQRGELYTLERHLKELGVDPFANWVIPLRRSFEERVRAGKSNYDDTIVFLKAIARRKTRRFILSHGDTSYQSLKVYGLNQKRNYFEALRFTSRARQKAHVLQQALRSEPNGPIVMLDDNATELEEIATLTPSVRRIQVRRTAEIEASPHAHAIVSDLKTALEVLS